MVKGGEPEPLLIKQQTASPFISNYAETGCLFYTFLAAAISRVGWWSAAFLPRGSSLLYLFRCLPGFISCWKAAKFSSSPPFRTSNCLSSSTALCFRQSHSQQVGRETNNTFMRNKFVEVLAETSYLFIFLFILAETR